MDRRAFIAGAIAASGTQATASNWDRHLVTMNQSLPAGKIYVNTSARFLYLTLRGARALRYGISVGAEGRAFTGQAIIS